SHGSIRCPHTTQGVSATIQPARPSPPPGSRKRKLGDLAHLVPLLAPCLVRHPPPQLQRLHPPVPRVRVADGHVLRHARLLVRLECPARLGPELELVSLVDPRRCVSI